MGSATINNYKEIVADPNSTLEEQSYHLLKLILLDPNTIKIMSINEFEKVDFIALDDKTDEVFLYITDHFSWDLNFSEHIYQLQEKINSYLSFIESGELEKKYPMAINKMPVIKIISKFPMPEDELIDKFINKAISIVQWAGFDLRFELFNG